MQQVSQPQQYIQDENQVLQQLTTDELVDTINGDKKEGGSKKRKNKAKNKRKKKGEDDGSATGAGGNSQKEDAGSGSQDEVRGRE